MPFGGFKRPSKSPGSAGTRAQSQPWPKIVETYQRFVGEYRLPFEPMLKFVEQVTASKLANELYPHTSMHDLVLHAEPDAVLGEHSLAIHFNHEKDEFVFSYRRSMVGTDGMQKSVKEAEAWATLLVFLRHKYGIHQPEA
jgi:hypothetical protein